MSVSFCLFVIEIALSAWDFWRVKQHSLSKFKCYAGFNLKVFYHILTWFFCHKEAGMVFKLHKIKHVCIGGHFICITKLHVYAWVPHFNLSFCSPFNLHINLTPECTHHSTVAVPHPAILFHTPMTPQHLPECPRAGLPKTPKSQSQRPRLFYSDRNGGVHPGARPLARRRFQKRG